MNRRQLIIKFFVWLGLKFPDKFIRELAKVEYGVAWYVRNLGDEMPEYKNQFYHHATQEKYHGRMLSALVNELPESRGGMGAKRWACSPFAGNIQVEGISKRYRVLGVILKGKSLNEYSFMDRLSIMAALESIALDVYREIFKQAKSPLKEVAKKIAQDEYSHNHYLTEMLALMDDNFSRAIAWERRIINALPMAIVDAVKIIKSKKNGN